MSLLEFRKGVLGMAFNLDADEVGVILLDESEQLQAGSQVRRTGRLLDVPVGEELLGRVIDPVGRPLDRKPTLGNRSPPARGTRCPADHGPRPGHGSLADRTESRRCPDSRRPRAAGIDFGGSANRQDGAWRSIRFSINAGGM